MDLTNLPRTPVLFESLIKVQSDSAAIIVNFRNIYSVSKFSLLLLAMKVHGLRASSSKTSSWELITAPILMAMNGSDGLNQRVLVMTITLEFMINNRVRLRRVTLTEGLLIYIIYNLAVLPALRLDSKGLLVIIPQGINRKYREISHTSTTTAASFP